MLIALTFWFVKFDNNVTILQALLDAGRYPATVYPPWLRLIVTFVVPIAVATTVPLQALRGDLSGGQVLLFLLIGLAAFLVATRVWRLGVKHYSGASSSAACILVVFAYKETRGFFNDPQDRTLRVSILLPTNSRSIRLSVQSVLRIRCHRRGAIAPSGVERPRLRTH